MHDLVPILTETEGSLTLKFYRNGSQNPLVLEARCTADCSDRVSRKYHLGGDFKNGNQQHHLWEERKTPAEMIKFMGETAIKLGANAEEINSLTLAQV